MKTLNSILMPILATEDKQTTNYMIAKYILNHADNLQDISTASLALGCNVSKASISRFCKYVGLDDFYTLKYLIRRHQMDTKIPSSSNIFEELKEGLAILEAKVKSHPIKEMIHDIECSYNVILMGTPQTFGSIVTLQHHLASLGKIVTISVQPHEQEAYFKTANKNDVILMLSEDNDIFSQLFIKQNRVLSKIFLITLKASDKQFSYIYKTMELGFNSPIVFSIYVEIIAEYYKQYKISHCLPKSNILGDIIKVN